VHIISVSYLLYYFVVKQHTLNSTVDTLSVVGFNALILYVKSLLVEWHSSSSSSSYFSSGTKPRQMRRNAIYLALVSAPAVTLSLSSVDVAGCSFPLSNRIKVTGVTVDSHLSFDKHISSICKSAFYHTQALRIFVRLLLGEGCRLFHRDVPARLRQLPVSAFWHHAEKH